MTSAKPSATATSRDHERNSRPKEEGCRWLIEEAKLGMFSSRIPRCTPIYHATAFPANGDFRHGSSRVMHRRLRRRGQPHFMMQFRAARKLGLVSCREDTCLP